MCLTLIQLLLVVKALLMDVPRITKSTAKMLVSYLTYEAVRVVYEQLQETNLPKSHWFAQFSGRDKIQNGEQYLEELLEIDQELAFRVMTVREHLVHEVLDFLPEMTRAGVHQSAMQHRRRHLEKVMMVPLAEGSADWERIDENLH